MKKALPHALPLATPNLTLAYYWMTITTNQSAGSILIPLISPLKLSRTGKDEGEKKQLFNLDELYNYRDQLHQTIANY